MARSQRNSRMAIALLLLFVITTVASRFTYPEALEVRREEAEGNEDKANADSVIHFPDDDARGQDEPKDKVNIVPFYIIDAPDRSTGEIHGCGSGKKWALGHCRDIVE